MDDQQRARELRKQAAKILGDAYNAAYFFGAANDALSETPSPHCQVTITAITAALRAAPEWEPIDTAPKDDRVLVRCESGSVYAAHWVQNPTTGDEAWLVCALEDGTQMLVHPVEWLPLPVAARPQGVKDAT